jgi:hypothetical protein
MARQSGPTACEIKSSQLMDVIAKPSRVDDVPPDFSRLSTGQKPVTVFLNDFFSGTVPAYLERIAPARCTIDAFNRQPVGTGDLNPAPEFTNWDSSNENPGSVLIVISKARTKHSIAKC